MSLKRFFVALLIAVVFFIVGMLVGRFVMPREIHITMIDVKDMVDIIERYNELKYEFEKIKEWNEEAVTESVSEEENK
ncbi:MAG: hypothetical protein V3U91_04920 [Candidatus Aminicenantaceae bacterium]